MASCKCSYKIFKKQNDLLDLEKLTLPYKPIEKRLASVSLFIDKLEKEFSSVKLFNPLNYTCNFDKNVCYGIRNGKLLFSDADHLSSVVTKEIAKDLIYELMYQ